MTGALRQFTARKPTGSAFSPADLTPEMWFEADQIIGLSDTDKVATWPDSSGNGRDATQATPANQPTYRTSVQNGLPAVRFDTAALTRLATGSVSLSQPNTILLVASYADAGGTRNYFLDGITTSGRHGVARGISGNNGTIEMFAGAVAGGGTTLSLPIVPTLFTATFDGASSSLRVGGAPYIGPVNAGTHTLSGLTIGSGWSGAFGHITGDFFAVGVVGRLLTSGEISDVETYLSDKWGL